MGTGDGGVSSGVATSATFEGTVQMDIAGTLGQVTFELKGDKVRWSILPKEQTAGYRIYDASTRRLFTVDPNVPSVLVGEIDPPSDALAPVREAKDAPAGPGATAWTITLLGADAGARAGSVAGHPCDRFVVTSGVASGPARFEGCVAQDMAPIPLEYAFPNVTATIPFLGTLAARGRVPLDVSRSGVVAGQDPTERAVLTTMQLRQMPIDTARFTVPSYPVTNVKHLPPPRKLPR
jgi:hypothetical protein